jgi:rSAM/selenodomain-associated transferase 1
MASSDALLVFAKAPIPGRVKTRLLRCVSAPTAAAIHKACVKDTLHLAHQIAGCDVFVFASGGLSFFRTQHRRHLHETFRRVRRVLPQRGRDLGARLENAFRKIFQMGYRGVVVIGTDTPWMGPARVQRAFQNLTGADVVVGPCEDGGYYLLGARRFLPDLFRGIPWGTSRVCKATLRAAASCGARKHVLSLDFDLDRPRDLRRVDKMLSLRPGRAPQLAELLKILSCGKGVTPGERSRGARRRRLR